MSFRRLLDWILKMRGLFEETMDLSRIFLAPLWILCSLWRLWQRFSHATYVSAAHNVRSLPGTMIYLIRGALCSKLEPLKCNHGNDLWNLLAYIVIIIIIIIFPSASFKLAHNVSFIDSNFSEICWIFSKGPSIKDVGIFWAIFDIPLPHVGISTLICLTSTF